MPKPIRNRRLRALRRSAVALACASVMALTGLPGITLATAAPKPLDPGKRCDELYGLPSSTSPTVALPEFDASRAKSQWDEYEYVNPAKEWDGLGPPSAAKEAALSQLTKAPATQPDRVWWRWLQQKDKYPKFEDYRDAKFITNSGNDPRGKAFERKVIKDHGLVGPDWICQKEVEFKDPDTGKTYRRKLDAFNTRTKQILEIKSNGSPDRREIPKDLAWAKDPNWKDSRAKFVFAEPQKADAKKFLGDMRQIAGDRVTEYNYRSDRVELAPKGGQRATSSLLEPPGQSGTTRGGATDLIRESRPTPKDMAEYLNRRNVANPGGLPRGPGGVDFSTLDLKYIGKPVKGKGVDFAFDANEDPTEKSGWGGKAKAQLISDAFFTWLALSPDKFWVNLNPDEPDRIMDAKFGKTDAGRVLLEADLQMKHDFYKAMDPDTDLGKRYWAALPKQNGYPCMPGLRNWIEPKTAQVREQDGGIYILDTPLRLKSTAQTTITPGPGTPICTPNEAETKAAQRVIDQMIVPAVEKTINTAPQYADLRRVYTARVAAEYIRQQDAKAPTDYHKIINSGDVSRWPLRAPNQNWTREALFNKYRYIYTHGEFEYKIPANGTVQVYLVGGVDLSKQPKHNVSKARFTAQHRYLPRQAQTSVKTLTDNTDMTGRVLLGANTAADDTGTSTPTPTPTPTPTHTGKPTPTPTHSAGGGGSTRTPPPATPAPSEPGGDLAHTGNDSPIGLISGIAAALAVAGGALVWWMRRRKTAQE
ncbi:hypothetical protein [Streptomyces sp. AK02-04a]|uniref:hypothetical protein n=1 Tax=Streptomyces sp. AK02-04a TaxID=3028649 RepID=UPI0029B66511|nr:hypothetical protein [Streptomyces sp. AK02-04a]MDX3761056.1 hypothetical protein [Streptomyces sp. AK02-04a]